MASRKPPSHVVVMSRRPPSVWEALLSRLGYNRRCEFQLGALDSHFFRRRVTMRMTPVFLAVIGSGILITSCPAVAHHPPAAGPVNFVAEVQPILRRHCFRCHGSQNQEASLQLNQREAAFAEADSGEPIIVKQDPEASLLIKRLVDEDFGDLMPLDGQPLSKREVEILRNWIAEGAGWPDVVAEAFHWAYRPITPPKVSGSTQAAGNPIDQFIARRLRQQGMTSSPPADGARLIRRVSLALTGLPPSPQDVDAFLADRSENAYEVVVDRLLASERYGERWSVPWLDLARYADSNGFQADQIRDNWAYRDWVIRAFNSDMPFDQFVIDQLAGDLRPNSSVEQKIATGFHRMTTCNVEAGVHPEANRVNQIVDRVNTTATVFLGTTLECAQCHDHKYDPFTQKDYYQIFAYFNNTPLEVKNTAGVTWDFYGPVMDLPMGESSQRVMKIWQISWRSCVESVAKRPLHWIKNSRTGLHESVRQIIAGQGGRSSHGEI